MDEETKELIEEMERHQIVKLLEEVACIQCYEHEETDELREALRVNVEDGTIHPEMLQTV